MTADPGPLIASGRAADVFDIGDGKVLRRYRQPLDDVHERVRFEARLMRFVAERGVPVPEVYDVVDADLIMERIDGPTMLEALEAAPWKILWHARLLARLQKRVARIEAPDWMRATDGHGTHAQRVLHLDLHPVTVILSQRHGAKVIDWTNAAAGPPGFDAALTFVEISTFEVTSSSDRVAQRLFAQAFRWFRGRRELDAFVEIACDHRLADAGITPAERIAVAALRTRARS